MFGDENDRDHVAWDIETTGFAWDDEITVSGYWWPAGHADLLVNTSGGSIDTDACERHLRDASGGVPVTLTACDSEPALLREMRHALFHKFDRSYNRLIAFNAEVWKGGFDLPFTRTSCVKHGVDWVFDNVQFADLWDVLCKRLNTTHTAYGKSNDINTLTGSHAILFGSGEMPESLVETRHSEFPWYRETQYDPFADSGSAVAHYERGEYLPILQHNLADIHRTWELGELIREFVAGKDITTKRL